MLTAALVLLGGRAAAAPVDPALFGALPDVVEMEISPSGRYVAALQNLQGRGVVLFYDLKNPQRQPTGVSVGATNAQFRIAAGIRQLRRTYVPMPS